MLLQNKNAVIYGAGGAIGSSVARAFAREGAKLFLTGHSIEPLKKLAEEIDETGGLAEIALVDALSEHEVNKHFRSVLEKVAKIDISFNAMGISQTGIQGIPLTELSPESFTLPIMSYSTSHFLTAKAAAQHMIGNKSGIIITLTATPSSVAAPLVGGMAPAWASIEALTRTLASELGSYGIRVVCLRSDGIPETHTITEVFGLHAKGAGMKSHKEFQSLMESMTLLKRLPTLVEVANTAVFIASDQASAITGTVINLSCGSIVD